MNSKYINTMKEEKFFRNNLSRAEYAQLTPAYRAQLRDTIQYRAWVAHEQKEEAKQQAWETCKQSRIGRFIYWLFIGRKDGK